MQETTCCFFGHRKIIWTEELNQQLYTIIENLILEKKVDTFLFGSKSQFNDLCYKIVTEYKEEYCNIKRIYVRAEFPNINDTYKKYLLQRYEDTYYPSSLINAGKSVYIQRNYAMIDKSSFCVIYYDENYLPTERTKTQATLIKHQCNSGTKLAYDYTKRKGIWIENVFTINHTDLDMID